MFTSEVTMLSGRRGLARIVAGEAGEVVEVRRDQLLGIAQTDCELSKILLRAFVLRRLELIEHGLGDAVTIGSAHCSGTLRIHELLTRNGHPFSSVDLDRDAGVQDLLDHFHVGLGDIPVVACRAAVVLRNPTHQQIERFEGAGVYYAATFIEAQLCSGDEVVVVGAGNSAGQAAVYLVQTTARVHMLIRGECLARSMSRYLIRRIEQTANIALRLRTEIVKLEGDNHLERVHWIDRPTGRVESRDVKRIFTMTGAVCWRADSSDGQQSPLLPLTHSVARERPLPRCLLTE